MSHRSTGRWLCVLFYTVLSSTVLSFTVLSSTVLSFTVLSVPVFADARLAIIIDDIGYNQMLSERAARLPGAFTLSILPFTPHSVSSAQLAHREGKELMLHAPMSNLKNIPLGQGGLYSSMGRDAFISVLRQDLTSVPFIKGVNNHMGSRLTQEAEPMQWLMDELRGRDLYFVDSRTSAQTKAFDTARANNIPSLKRDVFLDDIEARDAIEFQLKRALQFAQQRGSAVAIGHPYPITLSILETVQPWLGQQGVRLVYASELVNRHEIVSMRAIQTVPLRYCPAPPVIFWMAPNTRISIKMFASMTIYDFLVIN